ncbi:hypothetical protein, partial [Campylobacter sp.]|uniref:hypothetical protein n=1 Tax=Campylobacter sp. TaxID=205 RepID=UPI002A80749C
LQRRFFASFLPQFSKFILEFRHCEALKKPKQSHSKFRLKFRHYGIPVIAREQSRGSNLVQNSL